MSDIAIVRKTGESVFMNVFIFLGRRNGHNAEGLFALHYNA